MTLSSNDTIDLEENTATILNASILRTPGLTPLKVSQFMNFSPNSTPGNVGLAISGGSSRSMVAGMGQLRGLKELSNSQGNLLGQTRAISAVSGGSWLTTSFMYLNKAVSDNEFLGTYCEPSTYTVENLLQLDESNIGKRCTSHFSAKDLSLAAVLLIIAGLPHYMVWQVLIGIHILKPYDLYSQSAGLPNDFFSYDKTTLLQDVIHPNPSLAFETAYLITSSENCVTRPYFICNASMFVNVSGQVKQSLAPVQITPFFTGIFSTPPHALDANHQPVGGGGSTSFAFNSDLCAINPQNATLTQLRQFSLADATGTSSSFFAEYLEKQAILWRDNIKDFFDDIKGKLSTQYWQHIIDNVPVGHGKIINKLLNKLQTLSQRVDQIDHEKLLKVDIDPRIFHNAFEKLSSIVPQYRYWSVNNVNPSHDPLNNAFADGGNLENTGINALLLYQNIDNIIAFINSSTPLTQTEHGIIDASGQEIPGTAIGVSAQIPPLFGYQPYDDHAGYKLYNTDPHPSSPLLKNNQVFPSEAFAELLKGLWQASGNKDFPGSNQHAANYLQDLTTTENSWFNITGGKNIRILWVYNNFINDWYEQLSDSVRQEIFNNDPYSYYNFPNYSTIDSQLTPTQINLLAAQTSWSVCKGSANEILSMYQTAK